jgi:hypothetical protein
LGKRHILDKFLYGAGVFEPGLIISDDVGVVEFGEKCDFL